MFIRDVLSVKAGSEIICIEPGAPISEAVKRLVEKDIGSLVVMHDGRMVGFITERDIMRGMHARGCSLVDVKVSDLMEKEPVLCNPEDSVDYARDVLTKSRLSHLVVMDNNQLLGVISFHDVAKACLKQANFENSLLKRYIRNWPE